MYENGLLGLLEHACALCNRFCGVFSIHRRNHSRDHETLASILKFPMKQVVYPTSRIRIIMLCRAFARHARMLVSITCIYFYPITAAYY